MRIDILGTGFDNITREQAVTRACEIISGGERAYVVTPNPEIVWAARQSGGLRDALDGAALVLPDGIGIILGARILGTPIRGGRVPGIDFASDLLGNMARAGQSVFLLGAKPGVAEEAGVKLAERCPGLIIAGCADGYFSDSAPVIEKINAVNPDLLLVCLGFPKQELWMSENLDKLDVKLCIGLGGALDVFAGKAKRAPVFWQTLGLEWLYRLACEPRRITRMIKLPAFLIAVMRVRMRGKNNR